MSPVVAAVLVMSRVGVPVPPREARLKPLRERGRAPLAVP